MIRARCQWLTPVILATQEAEIRRITVQKQPRKTVCKTLSHKKPFTKIGLVKALSSSPSTTKKKKKIIWYPVNVYNFICQF
jgi:hypothetical protein